MFVLFYNCKIKCQLLQLNHPHLDTIYLAFYGLFRFLAILIFFNLIIIFYQYCKEVNLLTLQDQNNHEYDSVNISNNYKG